jgi:hypothetical protein
MLNIANCVILSTSEPVNGEPLVNAKQASSETPSKAPSKRIARMKRMAWQNRSQTAEQAAAELHRGVYRPPLLLS